LNLFNASRSAGRANFYGNRAEAGDKAEGMRKIQRDLQHSAGFSVVFKLGSPWFGVQ
jgi:hypothetical protein